MSTATIQSLKNSRPSQVQVTFDDKELGFVYSNSGEFISTIEISASFTRPVLFAILKVQKKLLDKLNIKSINKFEVSTLKITVVGTDTKTNYTFSRRFMINEITDASMNSAQGKEYIIKCIDVYGYAIYNDLQQIKDTVFNDGPINNVVNCLTLLFNKVDEKYPNDNKITVSHDEKYEYKKSDLPKDFQEDLDNKNINLFQIVNDAPIVSLVEYCHKYNIRVYQDYNGIHVVQNPVLSKFNKFGYYLSDKVSSDSPYYICDYNLENVAKENTVSRKLKRVSVTEGKNTKYKQVDINMLIESVALNDDIDSCREFLPKEISEDTSNTNVTIPSLTYDEFYKALQYKTLSIFLIGDMSSLYPGVSVNLAMLCNEENEEMQRQGDTTISKTWFITGSTYKIILGTDGKCFCRLVLNRFDNPKDNFSKSDNNIYKIAKNKFSSELSLSGVIDDIKNAFTNTFNRLKNSFTSLKNSFVNLTDLLNELFYKTVTDFQSYFNDVKNALENYDKLLQESIREAKATRLIYNSSNYSTSYDIDGDLISDINDEYKGIDLNDLFANFMESLDKMGMSESDKTLFKIILEDSNRDVDKFKEGINDLFKDFYNKNNINISNKVLENTASTNYVQTTKTKNELTIEREKKLVKLREKQGIDIF